MQQLIMAAVDVVQAVEDASEVSEGYDTSSFEDDDDAPPQQKAPQQLQPAQGRSKGRKTKSPVGPAKGSSKVPVHSCAITR